MMNPMSAELSRLVAESGQCGIAVEKKYYLLDTRYSQPRPRSSITMPLDDTGARLAMRNAEMSAQGFRLEYSKTHLGVGDSAAPLQRDIRASMRKSVIVFFVLILAIFLIAIYLL